MSSGPQHYRAAERLIAEHTDRDVPADIFNGAMRIAQVHATLALAAATALTSQAGVKDWEEWCDATTVPRGGGRS